MSIYVDRTALDRGREALATPGRVLFEQTHELASLLLGHSGDWIPKERSDGTLEWQFSGASTRCDPRLVVGPTGHIVLYGAEGRRIVGLDPEGTVLHECEWMVTEIGSIKLARARVQLDCGQWIGIKPEAMAATTTLDLSTSPRTQHLTFEKMRMMAASAWNVPLENMQYFYPDESFTRDESGRVNIRLKKDGLYLLKDGAFGRQKFLSYMGAIPWARIDILNVVELYQSAPAGTGGAVFELISGLCDDQGQAEGPLSLRYRGLPTYPSETAYGLFCAFFTPEAPGDGDPFEMFMDPTRASDIIWRLRPDPPRRYFDRSHSLCVTLQNGIVQKVVAVNDTVAIPYVNPSRATAVSCERTVQVVGSVLVLRDGQQMMRHPLHASWGHIHETRNSETPRTFPYSWRAFFEGGRPPKVDPLRAHTLVQRFPDDGSEVSEDSTQLLVLELIEAALNAHPDFPARQRRIRRVLIDGFDPIIAGLVDVEQDRRNTILYRDPEWAQRNAQILWDRAARAGRLEPLRITAFLDERSHRTWTYGAKFDLIYRWIPFEDYVREAAYAAAIEAVGQALAPKALAIVAGPPRVQALLLAQGIRPLCSRGPDDLRQLPVMVEHLRIHPATRVKPELTVVLAEKPDTFSGTY